MTLITYSQRKSANVLKLTVVLTVQSSAVTQLERD